MASAKPPSPGGGNRGGEVHDPAWEAAEALSAEGGPEAMQLRVAEQYVKEFGQLARDASSTLIVPANLTDISSMIGVATVRPARDNARGQWMNIGTRTDSSNGRCFRICPCECNISP